MQYTFLSTAVALHVRNRSRASLTRSVLIKVVIPNDFVSHGPDEAGGGGRTQVYKGPGESLMSGTPGRMAGYMCAGAPHPHI